jgi:NACHT domain
VALAVGGWSGYLSWRALRWQESNLADATNRLVLAVRAGERDARRQLLGGHDRTIDVDFTFRPVASHNAQFAASAGHLEQVVSYYRALRPGRLVITGVPGAGKTVLAVELILGLVEARAPQDPVPVRLSAASWDTSHPVEAWLTGHLVQTYQLPPATAAALVAARLVLPVIDGLDEMDPDPQPGYNSRAAQALQALNSYQTDRAKADLVLTCRSGQYQALEAMQVWAEDAAQVQINPIPVAKAHQFIHRRVNDPGRWQKVLDTIDEQQGGAVSHRPFYPVAADPRRHRLRAPRPTHRRISPRPRRPGRPCP